MKYRIYPPIGVARLGGSTEFFVGPETSGHPGHDVDAVGTETPVETFKGADNRIKKQAARFRIFEFDDDGTGEGREFVPDDGASIEWTVKLANRKSAVNRSGHPKRRESQWTPGTRPEVLAGRESQQIDPTAKVVSGASETGALFDDGECAGVAVPLGEIRTDSSQRLLVLGADGTAGAITNPRPPLNSYYNNPNWYDNTADGTVSAKITLSDGTVVSDVSPAWVLVGPPNFAPHIPGLVTLYDVVRQVGSTHFGLSISSQPSFSKDIFPLLSRASRMQWVHDNPDESDPERDERLWKEISTDWTALADSSTSSATLRGETESQITAAQGVLSRVRLREFQKAWLAKWSAGDFEDTWNGIPDLDSTMSPANLTRAALEACVGQGFFPGIEAGVIMTDKTIYEDSPLGFDFRIDHSSLNPGDLTALMAVPWQADFLDCEDRWWPSQRPDIARQSTTNTDVKRWARGVRSAAQFPDSDSRLAMVENHEKLGFVVPESVDGQTVYVESQRDSTLPES